MIYKILKWLFYLTIRGYFRSIQIKGIDQIPDGEPVLFVSNHNSAFMDPILLTVHIKRTLYFLARGESFKSKFVSRIFKHLNMIAIYRPEFSPNQVYKNEEIFQKCFDHLKAGKALMVFPEGISKTERRLRKIKTGAARISLGAESQNDFRLNTKIVPIGINYSNPHYFRSDVFINVGSPIGVSNYQHICNEDPKLAVVKLTESIEKTLQELVVVVQDEKLDKLIKQIELLYKSEPRESNSDKSNAAQDFFLSKEIVKAVEYNLKTRPTETMDFQIKIDNYLNKLKYFRLKDKQIGSAKIRLQIWSKFFYFIVGLPLFIYGYLVNIIPFEASKFLAQKIKVRKDFIGSMKIAIGMFVFLFFYCIEILVTTYFIRWYWVIVFSLSLYPAGLFVVNYLKNYYLYKGNLRYIQLFVRRSKLIAKLVVIRQELIDELEQGRKWYLNSLKRNR